MCSSHPAISSFRGKLKIHEAFFRFLLHLIMGLHRIEQERNKKPNTFNAKENTQQRQQQQTTEKEKRNNSKRFSLINVSIYLLHYEKYPHAKMVMKSKKK